MKPFINRFDARFVSRWTERFYRRVALELAGDRSAKDATARLKMPATVEHPGVSRNRRLQVLRDSHQGRSESGIIEGFGYSEWYREFAGKRAQRHQARHTSLGVRSITAASLLN
ncbi:hypothetical protein [Variovorax saccharolyticus]|uniref:hypothetical protein n=1 Tax=Variovorax saccharolyticus TaxID=3053516 RepID=UPI0025777857|nr:hypothetical protein [Variovorax sp. J31P216]MDM0029852.1 hypothetical protein [Variovorax sp. J31P216]